MSHKGICQLTEVRMPTKKKKPWHGLSQDEVKIVRKIREIVPKITIKNSSIKWWQFHLWKYRKSQVPAIGLKGAIDIVEMVREVLKKSTSEFSYIGNRKLLSATQREVVIERDKSSCCKTELRLRRVYPFRLCCSDCNYDIEFEHEIIWGKDKNRVT